MILTTKYSVGDTIWFIYGSAIQVCDIVAVECCVTADRTAVCYVCPVNNSAGGKCNVIVSDENAFSSKEELFNTISERFYKSLEQEGSGSA